MDSLYNPTAVESRWQETWEAEGLYAAGAGRRRDDSFVICVPPPNVTGELHMGHALNGSIQDVLIRWHRMRGFDTLWQPGYDHAGISTQNVIEKQLVAEGTSRREIGREAFLERTWRWLDETGKTIMGQYRRLGASLDYARERFTMDDGYVEAVMTFFVRLWDAGWIYRENRIVNWCPHHQTAISDLEVEHVEMDDTLVTVRYPFAEGEGGISVATVRPATILADVAVAVHPDDPRYRDAVGREVVVPVVERRVPVIADARVDPEFGTGALKITPGHDPTDFEIGRDHGLEVLTVIGPDGLMTAPGFEGLDQRAADARVVEWLEERAQLEGHEPYRHSVGTCERCHSRIEPLVSPQWWCRMDELGRPAIEALRERKVRFHPESQHRFAIESLEQAPDWCVSRQLWWGHQIPIWTCPDGHRTCTWPPPDACSECGSGRLERDPDVLDTWFSSALWPFATLGWPGPTDELERYYPGDVNVTAREIIRLWENRMIFSGLFLLGEIPFTDVIITSTVLAADGRRMSKSLGTGVDPMEPIEGHGADATRYGLLKISSTQDVRYSLGAIEEGRKLANKLWNVARLILQQTEGSTPEARPRTLEERWILARLDAARAEVEDDWARFDFSAATGVLYHLTFDDFCDWYAEAVKPPLYDGDADCRATALRALELLLALLHPLLPHVTEEIWSHLPAREGRLIVSAWPEPDPTEAEALDALDRVQEAAQVFRRSGVQVELESDEERRIFAAVVRPERARAAGDVESELARLRKEIERAERMLANERFVANAPPEVVDGERAKLERYRRELELLGA
ncbi:MAG TPA: valine--tRNA ligase [Gaiella sp.]|uniref:valine--tRNA ligase n=1 Tax=Gaiella sp. TaxID=2663207 RepID=UPI002D7F359D|nr:valine--tRNA ligase [Gaiella sp.]HET9288188.1 valine--tRNA ligase [Gaiella sp.]